MKKTKFESVMFTLWAMISFALLVVERISGDASGGEFAIGIILWTYVINNMSNAYLK